MNFKLKLAILFNALLLASTSFAIELKHVEKNADNIIGKMEARCGCQRPERGPPGPVGPVGPPGPPATPIFASYSIPFPPGALAIDTYEPLPFTAAGLNASFPAIGGIILDSGTGIFTIPASGYYEINYGYSSFWPSGTIVGLGIFTGVGPVFDHIVPRSSISQGIGAQYQMTSGSIIIPLALGDMIALINTNDGGPPPTGNVPTDYVGLVPYPALNDQEQAAAYISFKKVGDIP